MNIRKSRSRIKVFEYLLDDDMQVLSKSNSFSSDSTYTSSLSSCINIYLILIFSNSIKYINIYYVEYKI